MRKTSSKKLNATLIRMEDWIKKNRDKLSIKVLIHELNLKLRGYYGYVENWVPLMRPKIMHSYL